MNPYQKLPEKAFWKPAIADKQATEISQLWEPKFSIGKSDEIATYGSCFAQHIGRALKQRKFAWHNAEEAPSGMGPEGAREFNYGIFSSRTGNIYTTTLLKQWVEWAAGTSSPPDEVWVHNQRFIDPFRPRIEPRGFCSPHELLASRNHTIGRFRSSIEQSRYFVFTLGLTESWSNGTGSYEYPMCPGTVGGAFYEDEHIFRNLDFFEVLAGLESSIDLMLSLNPGLRFILTVSPVPLTATNSGEHVLVATMHSKSTLRSVAGYLATNRDNVDYFPSYEIINSPAFHGRFFETNQRTVSTAGVTFVMDSFFNCLHSSSIGARTPEETTTSSTGGREDQESKDDLFCDEEFLQTFSRHGA